MHWSDSDDVLVYSKHLGKEFTGTGTDDGIVVVANLDANSVRETTVHLDLTRLGLAPDAEVDVVELISGARWRWGRDAYVRLDARVNPVHVLSLDYGSVSA